ncbi:hypothetical protein ABID82_004246 [Methylobacterium sp. PvP062]|uniref:Uncharacterized protein n=1 Tax=Methylobacterium radiotolerans TaxID=31998 RepID=A0ABV2NL83_9HYPH|nr:MULTISPECIES: hypothetical protein [unclassified Methylobacterium]KZC01410.1 hypothetical protein AU375_02334 [Methylobacterium radiotolerans]MBP2496008.1 hypothetical protein [Methylobacterium sp. PvP105]MBP2504121.1 hypothetical protein [Methylobacterium sp. PvP109]MCX7333090.1 hypothetical protein [Hyphomicrobiales bacterium]
MPGFNVKLDLEKAVRDAAEAFETLGSGGAFARAVAYSLNGVVMDGVGRFRDHMPQIWKYANAFTKRGLWYDIDPNLLDRIQNAGEASASVLILPQQSIWLKYSFGEGPNVREPGDVGIEAWFGDQTTVKIPVVQNIQHTVGGHILPGGKLAPEDARRIAQLAAAGYSRNTSMSTRGSASWGAFELKDGDPQANRSFYRGPGIYARPPRGRADQARKRTVKAMKEGRRGKPTTQFQDASGRNRTVPKVVNLDTPRLLFLSKPDATYESVATPSWDADMKAAAETMSDRMMVELAKQIDHALGKIR